VVANWTPRSRQAAVQAWVLASSRPRVLDEQHAPAAQKEAANRRVVAHIGRDTEDDDLVRVKRVEQRFGIRVREHVEVLLQ
jgi:hypothetical protein